MVVSAGADFVEIGMPFSDPVADGPVIQHSTHVALEAGMTVRGTMELVREAQVDVPVIAFGYLNPILAYGLERFLDDARDSGIAALLLTDLPAGEDPIMEQAVRESSLALIRLIAPTTDPERGRRHLADAEGFVYLISRLGVTGATTTLNDTVEAGVARVREWTDLPVALGFGIATGAQAAVAARYADGVVVGSALVECLGEGVDAGRRLMTELRSAIDAL